jgi:hypothetical protein
MKTTEPNTSKGFESELLSMLSRKRIEMYRYISFFSKISIFLSKFSLRMHPGLMHGLIQDPHPESVLGMRIQIQEQRNLIDLNLQKILLSSHSKRLLHLRSFYEKLPTKSTYIFMLQFTFCDGKLWPESGSALRYKARSGSALKPI